MKLRIIVSHNYLPCDEAKKKYGTSPELVHVCSSTSLTRDQFDEWAKQHFILDTECPNSCPKLNYTMCELANLWAGASLPDVKQADYIGLCHYRRLFDIEQVKNCIELRKPDIICAPSTGIGTIGSYAGIRGQYEAAHVKSDFDELEGYLKESFLYQKKPSSLMIWERLPVLPSPYNCTIMARSVFFDYIDRMFRVLFDLYKKLDSSIANRDSYQRRAIGFLGERYTSWYVTTQHLLGKNVVELPVQFYKDWKPLTAVDNRAQ